MQFRFLVSCFLTESINLNYLLARAGNGVEEVNGGLNAFITWVISGRENISYAKCSCFIKNSRNASQTGCHIVAVVWTDLWCGSFLSREILLLALCFMQSFSLAAVLNTIALVTIPIRWWMMNNRLPVYSIREKAKSLWKYSHRVLFGSCSKYKTFTHRFSFRCSLKHFIAFFCCYCDFSWALLFLSVLIAALGTLLLL